MIHEIIETKSLGVINEEVELKVVAFSLYRIYYQTSLKINLIIDLRGY